MSITYVKAANLNVAAGGDDATEIDLGLAIGEAAKLTMVSMTVYNSGGAVADARAQAALSFDPQDTTIAVGDDEQFILVCNNVVAGQGAHQGTTNFDFSNQALVTTRNLAFMLFGSNMAAAAQVRVYYEKYKPTANDLNALIAKRW